MVSRLDHILLLGLGRLGGGTWRPFEHPNKYSSWHKLTGAPGGHTSRATRLWGWSTDGAEHSSDHPRSWDASTQGHPHKQCALNKTSSCHWEVWFRLIRQQKQKTFKDTLPGPLENGLRTVHETKQKMSQKQLQHPELTLLSCSLSSLSCSSSSSALSRSPPTSLACPSTLSPSSASPPSSAWGLLALSLQEAELHASIICTTT